MQTFRQPAWPWRPLRGEQCALLSHPYTSSSSVSINAVTQRRACVAGRMRALYRRAMRLEVRFFSAVPGSPPRPCVDLLVVDFDETLTEADTTPSIIAAAVTAAEASASGAASCCLRSRRCHLWEAASTWCCRRSVSKRPGTGA